MGLEIERKFLVAGNAWRPEVRSSQQLRQGYLAIDGRTNVRVRTDGKRAWLTIKARGEGITRPEFEYEIPVTEVDGLLALCHGRIVEKTRHHAPAGNCTWEIDEFAGENSGLVVAEIELPEENAAFPRPDWLGDEVTADPCYLNSNLAVHPYSHWTR